MHLFNVTDDRSRGFIPSFFTIRNAMICRFRTCCSTCSSSYSPVTIWPKPGMSLSSNSTPFHQMCFPLFQNTEKSKSQPPWTWCLSLSPPSFLPLPSLSLISLSRLSSDKVDAWLLQYLYTWVLGSFPRDGLDKSLGCFVVDQLHPSLKWVVFFTHNRKIENEVCYRS